MLTKLIIYTLQNKKNNYSKKKKNHKTPKNKLIDIIKLLFVMNAILKAWEQDQPEEPEW